MLVNGIEIEIEHKPIKNLHLAVYPPNGRVHVSAPNEYTDEQIKAVHPQKMGMDNHKTKGNDVLYHTRRKRIYFRRSTFLQR